MCVLLSRLLCFEHFSFFCRFHATCLWPLHISSACYAFVRVIGLVSLMVQDRNPATRVRLFRFFQGFTLQVNYQQGCLLFVASCKLEVATGSYSVENSLKHSACNRGPYNSLLVDVLPEEPLICCLIAFLAHLL